MLQQFCSAIYLQLDEADQKIEVAEKFPEILPENMFWKHIFFIKGKKRRMRNLFAPELTRFTKNVQNHKHYNFQSKATVQHKSFPTVFFYLKLGMDLENSSAIVQYKKVVSHFLRMADNTHAFFSESELRPFDIVRQCALSFLDSPCSPPYFLF